LPFVTILASPATQTKREASTADEPQRVGRSLLAMEDEEAAFDGSTTSIVVVGLVAAVAAAVVVTALRHQRQRDHDDALNFV
jgi:hypothetical protein